MTILNKKPLKKICSFFLLFKARKEEKTEPKEKKNSASGAGNHRFTAPDVRIKLYFVINYKFYKFRAVMVAEKTLSEFNF